MTTQKCDMPLLNMAVQLQPAYTVHSEAASWQRHQEHNMAMSCAQRCRVNGRVFRQEAFVPRPVVSVQASLREEHQPQTWFSKAALSFATASLVGMSMFGQVVPPAEAKLTAGDPIKNPQTLLRDALPINNRPIRDIQRSLEDITNALKVPGAQQLNAVNRNVRAAAATLEKNKNNIIKDFAADKKAAGEAAIAGLEGTLSEFSGVIEAKNKAEIPAKQRQALDYVTTIEESMVKAFPFQVPKEYDNLPQLLGRATLEMSVTLKETPEGKPQTILMDVVLDGLNAPISAGNFLDLVQRKFYDGMEIQRADGFVVQTGDPDGPADGFVDPATGQLRTIPLEIRIQGEKDPLYEISLEDLGRANEQPVLPFNAYGTLAWARNEFENNSASSQVFFLLKDSELTPVGANLLDGRFAVFGYVVSGQDVLGDMKVGDTINYIKVKSGAENLRAPTVA